MSHLVSLNRSANLNRSVNTTRLVAGLGVAQLLAWGALYYAIAVVGEAISVELLVSRDVVFGAFTWALIVSGVCAPFAGRLMDRHGGRLALMGGALLGALGFAVLAVSRTAVGLFIGWSINGVAMALGLYEACFATLGQIAPAAYPRLVTSVTLIAGFASTISWPASHYLMDAMGWRALCLVYSVALCICAALYRVVVPKLARAKTLHPSASERAQSPDLGVRRRVRVLAWTFAGMALVSSAFSAHLLTILNDSRVSGEHAVWLASSIGAIQVVGRLLQVAFNQRDAVRLGLITFIGFFASAVLLLASSRAAYLVIPFVVLYGIANGLVTIVKATLPVQILGGANIGQVLGTFSRPALITRALAPWLFAMTMSARGVQFALLGVTIVGGLTLTAYVAAIAPRRASALSAPSKTPE